MPGCMVCTTAVGHYPMTGGTSETRRASVKARGPRTRVPDVPPNTSPIGETANGPSLARGPRLDPIGECYDAVHEPHPTHFMPALLRRNLDLLILFVIGALLVAVPQIDLAVAGLFFDDTQGFYLRSEENTAEIQ